MLNSKELQKDDDYEKMDLKPIESGTLDQLGRQHPSKGQDLTLHKQEVRINLVKNANPPFRRRRRGRRRRQRRRGERRRMKTWKKDDNSD